MLPTALILAAGVFILSSCSLPAPIAEAKNEILTVLAEREEIMEFFRVDGGEDNGNGAKPSEYVKPLSHDGRVIPSCGGEERTVVFPTYYNNADKLSTVSLIYGTAPLYVYGEGEDEGSFFGYSYVERFAGYDVSDVAAAFTGAGIECDIVLRHNPAPEGEVFAVTYTGREAADGLYAVPGTRATLYVSDKKKAVTADSSGKTENLVYLTFDDGPDDENTEKLLDILDKYGVKAAFFETGNAIAKNPALPSEVLARRHTLGCHSVTHDYEKLYATVDSLCGEVREWEKILSDALGGELPNGVKRFRFPGGSVGRYFDEYTRSVMLSSLGEMGYTVYDWDALTNDAVLYLREDGVSAAEYIKENFVTTLEAAIRENEKTPESPIIILMHETVDETVRYLPWMLEYMINRGCVFGDMASLTESHTFY